MNLTQLVSGLNDSFSVNIPDHKWSFEWFIVIISLFIFIIGIIGNYLVIHVVFNNLHMRTITNIFIVNLAVGDLLVLLICLPVTTINNVIYNWIFGEILCKIMTYFQV